MQNVEEQIYKAISKVKDTGGRELTLETRFDSLGVTSLEFIVVVFELEDAFNITIVDWGLDNFETIADAKAVVLKLMAEKAAQAEVAQQSGAAPEVA
jgi:acyl carrier protein